MPKTSTTTELQSLVDITQILPERRVSTFKQQPTHYISFIEIKTDYQSRRPEADSKKAERLYEQEAKAHIEQMTQSLAADEELEPVFLVQIGCELHLVDGYHRHKAYKEAGTEVIPARIVLGNQDVARSLSIEINLKSSHINVSKEQQMQQMWELVCENYDPIKRKWTKLMRTDVMRILGAKSGSQIHNMQTKYKELGEDAKHMLWKEAKGHREYTELSLEERAERALKTAEEITMNASSMNDLACITMILGNNVHGQDTDIADLIDLLGKKDDQLRGHIAFAGMVEIEEF